MSWISPSVRINNTVYISLFLFVAAIYLAYSITGEKYVGPESETYCNAPA